MAGRTLRDSKGKYAGSTRGFGRGQKRGGVTGGGRVKAKGGKTAKKALTATQKRHLKKSIAIGGGAGFLLAGVGAPVGAAAGGIYAMHQIKSGRVL
jgi:hypothetical protein